MAIANNSTQIHGNHCPFCHASKPAIYADGAFFSGHCCEVLEQESEAREDLVPMEWISLAKTPLAAFTNWLNTCNVLGGAV